jgi:cell division protein FtsB
MNWPKNELRQYSIAERREILLVATEKAKTCNLTNALLELVDESPVFMDQIDDLNKEIECLKKENRKLEKKVEELS